MTQDAPLDQNAQERIAIFAADLGAADWTSALLKAYNPTGSTEVSYDAAKAALASDLNALSRRVPASGGEAEPYVDDGDEAEERG